MISFDYQKEFKIERHYIHAESYTFYIEDGKLFYSTFTGRSSAHGDFSDAAGLSWNDYGAHVIRDFFNKNLFGAHDIEPHELEFGREYLEKIKLRRAEHRRREAE